MKYYSRYDKAYFNKLAKGIKITYIYQKKEHVGFIIGHWKEHDMYPEYWIRENINSPKNHAEYEITCSLIGGWNMVKYTDHSFLYAMKSHSGTDLHPKIMRFFPPLKHELVRFFDRIRKGMIYGINEKDDGCKRWILLFLMCFRRLLPDIDFPMEMVLAIGEYLRYPHIPSSKKDKKKTRLKKIY